MYDSEESRSKECIAFKEALTQFIVNELRFKSISDYTQEAIQIYDARNYGFRCIGCHPTDESENIYQIAGLCFLNEEMELEPDPNRLSVVFRNCW